jgi:quercetin dioxygenase-like cupin family protein
MKARLCVALCALGLSTTVVAQDAVKTSPNNTKVVLENEKVRVYEFWAKTGEKMAVHSHPDHLVYVMGGGKVKFTAADGKVTENDMKAGQAIWVPATTHSVDAVSGDIRAVVVEIKK